MKCQRLIDLSIAIEPDLPSDPPNMIPQIQYSDHDEGAKGMKNYFPGITEADLPGGLGWAVETLTLTTHSGTHLDAPYHYHPKMDPLTKSPWNGAFRTVWSWISDIRPMASAFRPWTWKRN
jgi:kynurenine formamidase